MAALRTSTPSLPTIFRFASQPTTATATRRCAHCLRAQRCPFSSFRPVRQSSKRPLMTETVRPQTMGEAEILPLPPRNDGVPETSIAGGAQSQNSWPPAAPWRRQGGVVEKEGEGEAQKSKPVVPAASTAPPDSSASTTPSKRKKSKLRPRKAPITLTPPAVTQLRALFDQPTSKLIRIGVKNRGCSGLAYHLEYVDKPGTFDETVEQDGVKVLIDSKALFSIIGSEMDWVQEKLGERFVFRNPNITEECGCGESFSIS